MHGEAILDKHWVNNINFCYNLAYSNQSLFPLKDEDKLTFSYFLLGACTQIKFWFLWVINIILDLEISSEAWLQTRIYQ